MSRPSSWNAEDLEFLRNQGPNLTPGEIAKVLGRPIDTVKGKMRQLKVDWKRVKELEGSKDQEIKELWSILSPHEIAAKLNISKGSVYSAAKRLGLEIIVTGRTPEKARKGQEAATRVQRKRSISRALDKFGIWTPESAYIFGVLWADGCVGKGTISLRISSRDKEWLSLIGNWIKPGIHISDRMMHCKGKLYPSSGWDWCCVGAVALFKEMGMPHRKSYVDPPYPVIPDEFFSHFARGVQDGDGSPTKTSLRWYGSSKFMEGFREQAIRVWVGISTPQCRSFKSLKALQWGAARDRDIILSFLYKDAGQWYLPRKRKSERSIDLKDLFVTAKTRGFATPSEIELILQHYRRFGFPYPSLEEVGIKRTLEKLKSIRPEDCKDGLNWRHNKTGQIVATMFHPSIWSAHTREQPSYFETFYDDVKMRKVIRDRPLHGHGYQGSQVLVGIRHRAKGPANYPPAVAKAIYEEFLPSTGGNVLDPCAGYGGRLLGALCCDKVKSHVALEPATKTFEESQGMLEHLRSFLGGEAIRKIELLNTPAETYCPEDKRGYFDLIFTSPPYFNQEIYSNESNQVASTCKNLGDYIEWCIKVLKNWKVLLKPSGTILIQVSDPKDGSSRISIIDSWKQAVLNCGLRIKVELKYVYPGGRGNRSTETILII